MDHRRRGNVSASSSADIVYTEEQLVAALDAASSSVQQHRQQATDFLTQLGPQSEFQWHLVQIVATRHLQTNLRLQAILLFKNGLDRYWRSIGSRSVSNTHKALIRPCLLTLVDERDSRVANIVAECIAKIARIDYNRDWPDLFTTMFASMQGAMNTLSSNGSDEHARLVLDRTLHYWYEATKSLTGNRLARGKQIIGQLAEQALPLLIQLYHTFFAATCQMLQDNSIAEVPAGAVSEVGLTLTSLKILNKLVVYAWGGAGLTSQEQKAAVEQSQSDFYRSTLDDFVKLLHLRTAACDRGALSHLSPESRFVDLLNRLVTRYVRFSRGLLLNNYLTFHRIGVTQQLTQVCWQCVEDAAKDLSTNMTDDARCRYPEKFVVKCLLLVRSCFSENRVSDSAFKSPELALDIFQTVVTRILPLRQGDLELWQNDPEDFALREEAEQDTSQWRFDLRPAAETVLQDLMSDATDDAYNAITVPWLAQALQSVRQSNDTDLPSMLRKEAIYVACGVQPTALRNAVDFSEWLTATLAPGAQQTQANAVIVRRRIAWLLGRWMNEESSDETQGLLFATLSHLLSRNGSTDLVTRLTAAKALTAMEYWVAEPGPFYPYIPQVLQGLAELINEVESPELHLRLNATLKAVISRAGRAITPHLAQCMTIIPLLYASAEQKEASDQFKGDLVLTLKALVDALAEESRVLHASICPFVRMACDPSSPNHIFMQGNGFELWQALLDHAVDITLELAELAPMAVDLIMGNSQELETVLRIVDGYITANNGHFVKAHSGRIFANAAALLDLDEDKAAKEVLRTIDACLCHLDASEWPSLMSRSGLFDRLIHTVWNNSTSSVVTRYSTTLAQLAISSSSVFASLLEASAHSRGVPAADLWEKLLGQMLDRFDNQTYPGDRKLIALAMASLIQTTNPAILGKLDEMTGTWLSALSETTEAPDGEYVYAYVITMLDHMRKRVGVNCHNRGCSELQEWINAACAFADVTPAGTDQVDDFDADDDEVQLLARTASVATTDSFWSNSTSPSSIADTVTPAQAYYNNNEVDSLDPDSFGWDGLPDGNAGLKRKAELAKKAPVHRIHTRMAIQQGLRIAGEMNGGEEAFRARWLASIDEVVLKELLDYLHGRATGGD